MHSIASACAAALSAALLAPLAMPSAQAQSYPTKTVRVIIGYPAGSGNDVIARLVMAEVSKNLGQQFIFDNRPGASGNIGAELVARSAPDGYTLLNAPGSIAATPALTKNPTYDLLKDLEPVAVMASVPFLLVVHPSLPVKSAGALIQFAKARPNALTFASSGTGGLPHLTGELFRIQAGLKLLHVPYKGTGQANLDVIRGQVSMIFTPAASVMPHIQSGRLRALAVTINERLAGLPAVPTLAESALPGFDARNWVALFAPRGTPGDISSRLNTEINRTVQTPAMRASFASLGSEAMVGTPRPLARVCPCRSGEMGQGHRGGPHPRALSLNRGCIASRIPVHYRCQTVIFRDSRNLHTRPPLISRPGNPGAAWQQRIDYRPERRIQQAARWRGDPQNRGRARAVAVAARRCLVGTAEDFGGPAGADRSPGPSRHAEPETGAAGTTPIAGRHPSQPTPRTGTAGATAEARAAPEAAARAAGHCAGQTKAGAAIPGDSAACRTAGGCRRHGRVYRSPPARARRHHAGATGAGRG